MIVRAITVLTAVLFLAGAGTVGQTKDAQVVSDRQLSSYLLNAAKQQVKLERKYVDKKCPSARKAIVYYRGRTWESQRELRIALTPTTYPERKPGRCAYLRWRAKKWVTEARNARKQLEQFWNGSPYQIAKHIVYSIFPKETAAAALSVVDCETGGTYDESAYNGSTGVSGYFQIHPGNRGRVFHWRGKTLILDSSRLFDPWYNTTVAAFMSSGGKNWREWHCQPFRGVG